MRIFLSSTFLDLRAERDRLGDAIRTSRRDASQMEFFGARAASPLDVSLTELSQCDIMILAITDRYGTIDTASQLSITHLEFREAVRLKLPILAFIIRPISTSNSQVQAFISEVEATPGLTVSNLDTSTVLPERSVAALWNYVDQNGEPHQGDRVFVPFDVYFSGLLNGGAVFNHQCELVGRDSEIATLKSFLASDSITCLVFGVGGIGKSKLLLELARWASTQKGSIPQIRFCRVGMAISEQSFRELPASNVCIVADDAHRLVDFDRFAQICLDSPRVSKLILSARPAFEKAAMHGVRQIPSNQIVRIDVPALSMRERAPALASTCLNEETRHLAPALVAASDGNPLIITVGARLLINHAIHPALLERKEDFVAAALEGLLTAVANPIEPGIDRDRLLSILAAIQPFAYENDLFWNAIAGKLQVSASNVALAISTLDRHGLLTKRSASARIAPDVLGDHLLFKASVTQGGKSTGFLDEILAHFGEAYLGNIVANGAELDWRTRAEGGSTTVLSRIWDGIEKSLPTKSLRERRDLLVSLGRPVQYAQNQPLRIAQWCIENPEAVPEKDLLVSAIYKVERHDELDAACHLLSIIAQDPDLIETCVELLWKLARADSRPTNPNPSHPFRILKDLCTYQMDNPLAVISATIRTLDRIVNRGDHIESENSLCDILDEAMEREVELRESDGRRLSLSARPVAIDRVAEQRRHVLSIFATLGLGKDAPYATRAIESLDNLLRIPHFKFGRETTQADLDAFRPEMLVAVGILERIASEGELRIARYVARRTVADTNLCEWGESPENQKARIASLPAIAESQVFDALRALPPEGKVFDDYEEERRSIDESCITVGSTLLLQLGSIRAVFDYLTPLCEELINARMSLRWELIIFGLCDTDAHALELADAAAYSESEVMRGSLTIVLRGLRQRRLDSEFFRRVSAVVDSQDVRLVRKLAQSLPWILHGGTTFEAEELRLVGLFIGFSDALTQRLALKALSHFGKTMPSQAIGLILSADFQGDSDYADDALSVFSASHGIDPARLTDDDIERLLSKLRPLRRIDDNTYHVVEFIAYAATRNSGAVIRMLLGRIDDSTLPGYDFQSGFRAIPFSARNLTLSHIESKEERIELLRQVREHALKATWQHHEDLPRLFQSIGRDIDEPMGIIAEWGLSHDEPRVIASAKLIRLMPETTLALHHARLAELIENAHSIGSKCAKAVEAMIRMMAIPRAARFVPLDGPDPVLVHQRTVAEGLVTQYAARPLVASCFSKIAESIDEFIKNESILDNDEDDEDLAY